MTIRRLDFTRWFAFKRGDMLLYAPFCISLGIGAYFLCPFEPESIDILGVAIFGVALFIASGWLHAERELHQIIKSVIIVLLLIMTGFCAAKLRTEIVSAPILAEQKRPLLVEGRVIALDILDAGKSGRVILDQLAIEKIAPQDTPHSVRIKIRKPELLRPGQRIRVLAALHAPSPPVSPGGFDFQRHSYFLRLGAIGFSFKDPEIISEPDHGSFSLWLESLRLEIDRQVNESVISDHSGVTSTLLTGEQTSVNDADMTAMRDSGLAHLLSISGLHVGLAAGVIFFFLRSAMALIPGLALRYPIKKFAAFGAFFSALFYVLLVGAPVPTQRSMMMTGVALFAIMIDRSPFSLRTVAIAAIVILLILPESLISPSFQMSFAAVTMLIWFYDRFRAQITALYKEAGVLRRIGLYVLGVVATTVLASAGTAPFSLYHFQNFSLYGPLANLIAIPVTGVLVMPLAIIIYLLMPFGLAGWPLIIMGYAVDAIVVTGYWVAALPGAVIQISAFPLAVLVLITVATLLMMLGPMILRGIGLVCVVMACGIFYFQTKPDIYVSSEGSLIGIAMPDRSLHVSDRRKDRFSRENWQQALGLNESVAWSKEGHDQGLACDVDGCRYVRDSLKVSLPHRIYAQYEDCLWADIMIVRDPPSIDCKHARLIDRRYTQRHGATTIYIKNGTYQIETVASRRGHRPWTSY